MTATYYIGESLEVLRTLPDNSVDLVLTSPPFLALRSYLPADHPDKAKEMGSEATPGAFIDALLDIVEECDRVVAPHGSIAIELGDTYSGSGGAGGDYGEDGLRAGQPKFRAGYLKNDHPRQPQAVDYDVSYQTRARGGVGWPLPKSLCLIPESFRWALVYGRNPFNGRETPQWRARNVARWCRPNPPVGALGDKFRPATSELVIACKSAKRYFDLDAVRYQARGQARVNGNGPKALQRVEDGVDGLGRYSDRIDSNEADAPPLDFWVIPTEPYKGSHYATFPSDLCVKPIKAMCPEKVCRTCGEPSTRIVERSPEYARAREAIGDFNNRGRDGKGVSGSRSVLVKETGRDITSAENITLGWTNCGHNDWRSGVVLDPFAGSGTTLAVATGHGRDAIGIDLDERNADLARDRVGLFLTVVDTRVSVA